MFDKAKKIRKPFRKKAKLLSIQEAQDQLFTNISEHTGWKRLKSTHCLKKTVNDLVFEIAFFSSKWNVSFERVEVQCFFNLYCKKFDKALNIHSSIGFFKITPPNEEWYDISDEEKLFLATKQICNQFDKDILPVCRGLEEDFQNTIIELTTKKNFDKYNLKLQFLDVYAGREHVIQLAQQYTESLPPEIKQDIEKYKQGDRSKAWMCNPSNLKYIIDNCILENV